MTDPPPARSTRGCFTAALAHGSTRAPRQTRARTLPPRLRASSPSTSRRQPQQKKKSKSASISCITAQPPPSPEPLVKDPPILDPPVAVHLSEPSSLALPATEDLQVTAQESHPFTTEELMMEAINTIPTTNDEPTLDQFAASLLNNPCLFGDEATTSLLNNFSINSECHELRKASVEAHFFYVLSCHPNFRFLCDFVQDPEYPTVAVNIRRFYVALRGIKNDVKKRMMNACLILFSQSFVKKEYQDKVLTDPNVFAEAQYEPSTVDMYLRCLFTVFKSRSIIYCKNVDFNQRGDFPAYWKNVFELTRKLRPEYGTKANASTFDPSYRLKKKKAISEGIFNPLTNYTHHTWMLLEELMAVNMLRGAKEPAMLCRQDFIHGVMPPNSKYAGRRFYRIRPTHSGQKGNALSLRNQSTSNDRNNQAYVPMVEPPPDAPDPLSLYNLLDRHLNVYLPTEFEHDHPSNDRIFRRMASNKQLEEWREADPNCSWLAGPGPTDVYGKNYINECMVALAKLCGYDNPNRCTAHGKRKAGVTSLVNDDGIGPKMTTNLTRHSNYSTVSHYEKTSQAAVDRCIDTLFSSNSATEFVNLADQKLPAHPTPFREATNQFLILSTSNNINQCTSLVPRSSGGDAGYTNDAYNVSVQDENCPFNLNGVPPSTGPVVHNRKKIIVEEVSDLPTPRALTYHEIPAPHTYFSYDSSHQGFRYFYEDANPATHALLNNAAFQVPHFASVAPPGRCYFIEETVAPSGPLPLQPLQPQPQYSARRFFVEEPPPGRRIYEDDGSVSIQGQRRRYYHHC